MSDVILTKETAQFLHSASDGNKGLLMWTVYQSPSDYPGLFISRPTNILTRTPLPSVLIAYSLTKLREALPVGLVRLNRQAEDDPVIVETWI